MARRLPAGVSRTKVILAGLVDRGVLQVSRAGYVVAAPEFVRLAREPPDGGSDTP